MAQTPVTPGGHDGEDTMDDHSDLADEASLENTPGAQDADQKEGKVANGKPVVETMDPTDYSLFSNPPNLGTIRQRLFEVHDTIEMPQSEFDRYFPFVDNVWRKSKSGEPVAGREDVTDIYWCRRRKASTAKPYTPKPTPEGKSSRKKRARDDITCPMAIKVVRRNAPNKACIVLRAVGPDVRHTHDLDYMDSVKRNTGIMDVARREAVRAFLPGSVFWKMQDEPAKMQDAGGKFMKISDVRNVQYAWRQENPNVSLKAHQGYSQASKGPKPKDLSGLAPMPSQTLHQKLQHQQQQQQHQQKPSAGPSLPPMASHPVVVEQPARNALQYPNHAREFLEAYLPQRQDRTTRPHVTLTWATSLDARISLMPNVQTAISGPETKAMTHYLRSRHDAIVVGVKTAIADDPSLNCRLLGAGGYGGPDTYQQPRPVIIDPNARLPIQPEMKVLKIVTEGRAKAPWIVVTPTAKLQPSAIQTLRSFGGEYLMINDIDTKTGKLNWESIFSVLFNEGLKSVMIEGGGSVLSELLKPRYNDWIDSVVLTIAPTFFGRAGVDVSPEPTYDAHTRRPIATRLNHVRWQPMGDADVVMCGHLKNDVQNQGMLPGIHEFMQRPPEPAAYPHLQNGVKK